MTDGGLVLPEFGMDEAAVRSALKEIDPDLLLIPPGAVFASRPEQERLGYRVYQRVAADREPVFIFAWVDKDTREPLPLSSAIVERAREADKNTRGRQLDELAREEVRRREFAKRDEAALEGAVDTWVPRHGRPILPRSQSLRRARDKRRANGEKV